MCANPANNVIQEANRSELRDLIRDTLRLSANGDQQRQETIVSIGKRPC